MQLNCLLASVKLRVLRVFSEHLLQDIITLLTVRRGRKAAKPLSLVVMRYKGRAIAPSGEQPLRGGNHQNRLRLDSYCRPFCLVKSTEPNDALSKGGFRAQAAHTANKDSVSAGTTVFHCEFFSFDTFTPFFLPSWLSWYDVTLVALTDCQWFDSPLVRE